MLPGLHSNLFAALRRHRLGSVVAVASLILGPPNVVQAQHSSTATAKNVPGITLRLEHTIAAPPEAVFRTWIDADAIRRWFVYNVGAHWNPNPIVEVRRGGHFAFSIIRDRDGAAFQFHGTYREIKSPKKLVFTWEWDSIPIPRVDGPGDTLVSIEFLSSGTGTNVILTQSNLPSEAARDAHRDGWHRCLDGIASVISSGAQKIESKEEFVRVHGPVVALEHVGVIDGTGTPAKRDQTIVISGSRIAALGPAGSVEIPANAEPIDLTGYTALPGLVGMHDHLFYSVNYFGTDGVRAYDMPFSFPRLYLAAGVTTIRTTGSFEPYTDLEIKKAITAGTMIGPKINVTGPYLEGEPLPLIQIHKLSGPEDARRTVEYWADEGAESFKAYADITRAELAAAIDAAHKRGLTITGHLCSIGFREAAEMGIDGLEHGLSVDTEFAANKQPDKCPDPGNPTAADLEVGGEEVQRTIRTLVEHHVAITSTLPSWEEFLPSRRELPERVRRALCPEALKAYMATETHVPKGDRGQNPARQDEERYTRMLRKEMEFERAFVAAGGLLLAGPDGVLGGDIAGFGDQRELEMLVEAGFTPLEAMKTASLNGARFLKQADRIGSLAVGKQADIMLVKGDPSRNIQDIENVEIVFKDGVGYDSKKLIESVKGLVGIR